MPTIYWNNDVPVPSAANFEANILSFLTNLLTSGKSYETEILNGRGVYNTLIDHLNNISAGVQLWVGMAGASRIDSNSIRVASNDLTQEIPVNTAIKIVNSDLSETYHFALTVTYNAPDTDIDVTGTISALAQTFNYSRLDPKASSMVTALSVDTPTFEVDAANNRVGVGTQTPSNKLHVKEVSADCYFRVETDNTNGQAGVYIENDARVFLLKINASDQLVFRDETAGVDRWYMDTNGNIILATDAVYLDAQNKRIGVGTASPSERLHVIDAVNDAWAKIETDKANGQAGVKLENDAREYHIKIDSTDKIVITDITGGSAVRLEIDASGNITVFQNLTVSGDLTVSGTTTTIDTATLKVEDNVILVNKGEVGTGVTEGEAGLEVDRGSSTNYKIIFAEADDTFKVGEGGSEQPVATRTTISNKFIPFGNSSNQYQEDTDLQYDPATDTLKAGNIDLVTALKMAGVNFQDIERQWSKGQHGGEETVESSGGTLTLLAADEPQKYYLATEDCSLAITGGYNGTKLFLIYKQHASSAKTLTFPAVTFTAMNSGEAVNSVVESVSYITLVKSIVDSKWHYRILHQA